LKVEVRRATENDSEAISSLLLEAFASVESEYTKGAFDYTTPSADAILARFKEGPIWVAVDSNLIVGTVSGLPEPDRFYIRSMAVKPEAQGRGVGQSLLETLERFAKEGGFETLYLYTTPSLHGAKKLYERNGFRTIRESPPEEFFGTAGVEMEKEIRLDRDIRHMLLEVKDLHAGIDGKEILKGLNLQVNKGEVHAIMGPNGSGKSTLSKVLAGHPSYEVISGEVMYEGKNLLDLEPDERAREGVFMAFQYPVEVPGVSNSQFLRLAYNQKMKHHGQEDLDPLEFNDYLKEKAKVVDMSSEFFKRSVNEGFSGGEKKRNEILQMAVLEPKLAILDETDSGLDIDALRIVAEGVNKLRSPENAIILVTHYQRLLNYIQPDFVHVLASGKIVKEGGKELAIELEEKGYDWVKSASN